MIDLRVLALGGGVQSSALLYMNALGEIDDPASCAIFADTGWEPPHVYRNLEILVEFGAHNDFPVHVVGIGNIREDMLENPRCSTPPFFTKDDTGKMGMIRRSCTRDYKMRPLARKMRALCGIGPKQRMTKTVEVQIGISWDEVHRMKPPAKETPWQHVRYPLIDDHVTRDGCLKWMKERDFAIPEKSSCIGCPYHHDKFWLDMKRHRKGEWREAVEFDNAIRYSQAAGINGELYLHRSGIPLEDCDFGEGQMELFDECGGYCFT